MSGEDAKTRAAALKFAADSHHEYFQQLILEGCFDQPVTSADLASIISERFGHRISTNHIQTYLKRFIKANIIRAIKAPKSTRNYYIVADVARVEAVRQINKERHVAELEQQLFSDALKAKLKKNFAEEMSELQDNFGRHGNCTAFLLRKILEKLLIISFGKIGRMDVIADKSKPGGWKGLNELIDIAAREKVGGLPILLPKTATEIKGIKFLGDSAAHNPLSSVEMRTIIPQMPYIITAYQEISRHL